MRRDNTRKCSVQIVCLGDMVHLGSSLTLSGQNINDVRLMRQVKSHSGWCLEHDLGGYMAASIYAKPRFPMPEYTQSGMTSGAHETELDEYLVPA